MHILANVLEKNRDKSADNGYIFIISRHNGTLFIFILLFQIVNISTISLVKIFTNSTVVQFKLLFNGFFTNSTLDSNKISLTT